ncbi:MAG: hypothetical protein IPP19_10315 [Verrucomicrobia bacterium]|nr:hypothetical protein [Verrucomicrobiota bacterium]
MKTYPLNRQRGSLPLVMILILALSIAMMGVTSYVNTAAKIVTQAEAKIKASHAAEAALEKSMADLNAHALSIRPGTPDLAGVTGVCNLSTVPTTLFPSSQGYTFTRNIAVPIENGIPITTFTNASDATKTYHYVSEASVTYAPPGGGPTATVTMQRAFTHQVIPLFQYAIFFGGSATTTVTPVPGNGDLEINPGQNFTVGGRVHSNNNVYYGSNATLTFQGVVTSAMATPIYGRSPRDPRTGYYGNDATFNNGTPPISPYKVDFIAFPL